MEYANKYVEPWVIEIALRNYPKDVIKTWRFKQWRDFYNRIKLR